jgi:hypothetical protein
MGDSTDNSCPVGEGRPAMRCAHENYSIHLAQQLSKLVLFVGNYEGLIEASQLASRSIKSQSLSIES